MLFHINNYKVSMPPLSEMIWSSIDGLWNHHPDYDPPQWKEFFEVISEVLPEDKFDQVKDIITGYYEGPGSRRTDSFDAFKEELIPHDYRGLIYFVENRELDIRAEEQLAEMLRYLPEDLPEWPPPPEEEVQEDKRKRKIGSVLSVLDEVMETKDQKLDEGKYVELCNLLKELHEESD